EPEPGAAGELSRAIAIAARGTQGEGMMKDPAVTGAALPRAVEHADGVLRITRDVAAAPELVFELWTNPAHFSRWFGPTECRVPYCTIDARVGGRAHFCVRMPGGEEGWGLWLYREVLRPERLVFADYFSDPDGNITERAGFPREALITVTFENIAGGTRMRVVHEGLFVDHGE